MFKNLEIFKLSYDMATHAAHRQSLVARNMANADSPGYVARDTLPFAETLNRDGSPEAMRATRASHLHLPDSSTTSRNETIASAESPNGNGVSLETEMLKAVDAKRQHDRALAIYRSGLNVLRLNLK